MVRLSTTLYLLLALSAATLATLPPPNNAVALSMGGSSATYLNSFGIENNVATLAFAPASIDLSASNRFGLADYSNLMLCGNLKLSQTSVGFSYQILPLGALTTQKAQLGISKKLKSNLSVGIALNFEHFSSTDAFYQSQSALTFNAGVYYQINKKLNAGFQIYNPNRTQLLEFPQERLPANTRLGINYQLADNIKLYSDVVQGSEERLDLNAGVELIKKNYVIRGGFGLNQLVALGFGWKSDKIQINVTAAYHNQLGLSPALNLGYAF